MALVAGADGDEGGELDAGDDDAAGMARPGRHGVPRRRGWVPTVRPRGSDADRAAAAAGLLPVRRATLALAVVRSHLPLSPTRVARWQGDPEAYWHAEAARAPNEDGAAAALALCLAVADGACRGGTVRPAAVVRVGGALRDLPGQRGVVFGTVDVGFGQIARAVKLKLKQKLKLERKLQVLQLN